MFQTILKKGRLTAFILLFLPNMLWAQMEFYKNPSYTSFDETNTMLMYGQVGEHTIGIYKLDESFNIIKSNKITVDEKFSLLDIWRRSDHYDLQVYTGVFESMVIRLDTNLNETGRHEWPNKERKVLAKKLRVSKDFSQHIEPWPMANGLGSYEFKKSGDLVVRFLYKWGLGSYYREEPKIDLCKFAGVDGPLATYNKVWELDLGVEKIENGDILKMDDDFVYVTYTVRADDYTVAHLLKIDLASGKKVFDKTVDKAFPGYTLFDGMFTYEKGVEAFCFFGGLLSDENLKDYSRKQYNLFSGDAMAVAMFDLDGNTAGEDLVHPFSFYRKSNGKKHVNYSVVTHVAYNKLCVALYLDQRTWGNQGDKTVAMMDNQIIIEMVITEAGKIGVREYSDKEAFRKGLRTSDEKLTGGFLHQFTLADNEFCHFFVSRQNQSLSTNKFGTIDLKAQKVVDTYISDITFRKRGGVTDGMGSYLTPVLISPSGDRVLYLTYILGEPVDPEVPTVQVVTVK